MVYVDLLLNLEVVVVSYKPEFLLVLTFLVGSGGGFWFWEFGVALFSVVCGVGLVDLGVSV